MNNKLWYTMPADNWLEGLPIGTGRLAGMVQGGECTERIALNHEWLFAGRNRDRKNEYRADYLPKVRHLLKEEKYEEATILANKAWGGNGGISGKPTKEDAYLPLGDFYFKLVQGEVSNYKRELDLDKARVKVSYDADGRHISRRVIAHLNEDYIIVHIDAGGQCISGTFWLDRIYDPHCYINYMTDDASIIMNGSINKGLNFLAKVDIRIKGGSLLRGRENQLIVNDSKEILIFINMGTDANGETPLEECMRYPLPTTSYHELYEENRIEYQKHYGKLKLSIDEEEPNIPTNERVKAYKEGNEDVTMPLLYFNYGRYLLCAASVNAKLPTNLQGKWNEDLYPAWDCDYHNDINLQMNYWPMESGNLLEFTEPLFTYLEKMIPYGKDAAKKLFGCDGIWLPLSSDAWGLATPETYGWSVWVGVAAWLSEHFWWHYEYSKDKQFLEKRAYPFIKEVAKFYESFLVKDEEGIYQIMPSQSPENKFVGGGEMPVTICVSSTVDVVFVQEVLEHAIRATKILGIDEEMIKKWQDILDHLPKLKIGSKGQLLEWNKEFEEVEPSHRHVSHLIGLYPGEIINKQRTPELYRAARISLEQRLSAGGGHTGWSRAWVACLYARIGEGDIAFKHLRALILDFATISLLDLHPPRIFQIDGNFGGVAAVLEMILQSYYEEIELLPGLPSAWKNGKITGIRARGGYTIDMEWRSGKLKLATIQSVTDRECTIITNGLTYVVMDQSGNKINIKACNNRITFYIQSKDRYYISVE